MKDHSITYDYYRGFCVHEGLPDPGPIDDIEDPVKIDKRKADLEAQANIMSYFHEELDSLQSRITMLRQWLNTYYSKPLPGEGLPIIEL